MDDPLKRPELVRRETLRRLEHHEERYSEWFQPQDNNLKIAGSSCTQVRDVFFSKLSRREQESALKEAEPEDLKLTVLGIRVKYLDKKNRWYSSEKSEAVGKVVESLAGFADIFTNVIEAVLKPAPLEYRAAFAILNFIYKGIKEKNDREEKLSGYLQDLGKLIPRKDFYHQTINTSRMREAFSDFCTDIIKFVIAADKYCTKLSIVKFILTSTTNDPMQSHYDDINKRAEEIESLREAASWILTLQHRDTMDEIATVLGKLYERSITRNITPEANAILSLAKYKSYSRAQKLASHLEMPPYDLQAEKLFNDTQRIHLPARDHWEYRSSMINFPEWEQMVLTPAIILKRLITTILSSLPHITISHVANLPLNRFMAVKDSGLKAWGLLVEILEIVQDVMAEQRKELFIILDRLDMCISDEEEFGVRMELLPRLQEIPQRWQNTHVIITSTIMAGQLGTLKGGDDWIRNVWIDTASAVSMDDPDAYED